MDAYCITRATRGMQYTSAWWSLMSWRQVTRSRHADSGGYIQCNTNHIDGLVPDCSISKSPLLTHWRYISLALSHRCYVTSFTTIKQTVSEWGWEVGKQLVSLKLVGSLTNGNNTLCSCHRNIRSSWWNLMRTLSAFLAHVTPYVDKSQAGSPHRISIIQSSDSS